MEPGFPTVGESTTDGVTVNELVLIATPELVTTSTAPLVVGGTTAVIWVGELTE